MSTKVRLVLEPRFKQIIGSQADTRLVLASVANVAVGIAQSSAPVLSGNYRDSIGVETDLEGVTLQAKDFKAGWIEFGTVRTKAFRTLTNAADQVARVIAE